MMMNRMMKKAAVLLGAAAMTIAGMTYAVSANDGRGTAAATEAEMVEFPERPAKSVYLGDYTNMLTLLGWSSSESDGSGMVGMFEENQNWTTASPLRYVVPTNVDGQRISSFHIQVLGDDVVNAAYYPYIDEDGVKQDEYVTFEVPTEEGCYHYSVNNITGEIVKSIPERMIFTKNVTNEDREFCSAVAQAMSIEYHNLLEEVQLMVD